LKATSIKAQIKNESIVWTIGLIPFLKDNLHNSPQGYGHTNRIECSRVKSNRVESNLTFEGDEHIMVNLN